MILFMDTYVSTYALFICILHMYSTYLCNIYIINIILYTLVYSYVVKAYIGGQEALCNLRVVVIYTEEEWKGFSLVFFL